MKKFKFNGNWKPSIYLEEFKRLTHPDLVRGILKEDQLNGIFNIEIIDFTNNDPLPLIQQTNTINFLLMNQCEVLHAILEYVNSEVYPKFKEFMWIEEYPECYPDLNNIDDLRNLLAVSEVFINTASKDDFSYIVFSFNSRLDYEHGLCITMHKLRCLGWCEMGNIDDEKIVEDGGRIIVDQNGFNDNQVNYDGVFTPNEKFGTLKPWQSDSSEDTFKKLLKQGESAKVIDLINKSNWVTGTKFPLSEIDLVNLAVQNLDKKVAGYLIQRGADIDRFNYKRETSLCFNFKIFTQLQLEMFSTKNNNSEKLKEYDDYLDKRVSIIKLYLELGANPKSCNADKEDYKQVLCREWNDEFLISRGIIKQIEELISSVKNNSKPRRSNWKFWKRAN